ncbi:MAG: hypothetical protein JO276_14165 [Sphingomonadaceae bacterium]|nr:hypothetical protein [Sphingomonadaceae bacterium]
MNPAIFIAIGIVLAAALVIVLLAVRRAGDRSAPEMDYGHELDAPPSGFGGRRARRPGARQRAMLALLAGMLAALGAGLATGLSQGHH